ncbi:MAG: stimulus-sensing domain-containing protein [Oceanicaulis sp.]
MASATVTRKLKVARLRALTTLRGWRRVVLSRLGVTILLVNGAALVFLLAGMAAITENRRGLVEAKELSLAAQAEIIANIISETAVSGDAPGPRMDADAAREVLRRLSPLYVPDETRALLHAPGPVQVADSDLIAGEVEEEALPPPGDEGVGAARGLLTRVFSPVEQWLGDLFQSSETRAWTNRTLEEEVETAFRTGEPQGGVRREPDGARIVSVTIPIQLIQAVVGTVTYESYDFEALIAAERQAIVPYALAAIAAIMVPAVWLTVSIALPVRALSDAAREVRLAGGRRVPLPDMSGRKDEIGQLGQAFAAMTNALYDRLDAIESFAADVSHEIKNPLTSIRSAAEILPLAKDDERRAKLIGVIQHDVRRLDRLITDISNASRLDAELAREDLGRIDMARLLREIVAVQTCGAENGEEADVAVTLETRGDLTVRGHEGPLGRVFINLVENAITFSPEGGTVRVEARRLPGPHGRIMVTVDDEGPGVPEENLEAIFERFYTQRPKGAAFGAHSGLGLAIARQIVSAHGGRIEASNRTGPDGARRGARFTVDLPAEARPGG